LRIGFAAIIRISFAGYGTSSASRAATDVFRASHARYCEGGTITGIRSWTRAFAGPALRRNVSEHHLSTYEAVAQALGILEGA
jgi:hypothetical protein